MLLALALPIFLSLLHSPAHAESEVGTARKLGLGLSFGNGIIGVAGKYWLSPTVGVSGYLGNAIQLQQLRANFEMDIFTVRDTEFGRFDLYWLAGIDAGFWAFPGFQAGKFGAGAGLGVNLKLGDFPADIFLDVGLGVYPADFCSSTNSCLLQPRADLGARYYFP
jgi:hypothetical protein